MFSKIRSFIVPNRLFSTLPTGERVFHPEFPWSKGYIINDVSTEKRLYLKTFWLNLLSWLFAMAIAIGLPFLIRYNEQFWETYDEIILLVSLAFAVGVLWLVYKNDLKKLKKIDTVKFIQEYLVSLQDKLRIKTNDTLPDYRINKYFDIPNHTDKIIILNYSKQFPNIVRCSSDGDIIWQSELPIKNDVYTNLEWEGQNLFAFSQSSQTVMLDLDTGKIVK
ncbi:MAG: hypothetical protein J0L96_17350 [Anaerolineae bacterium]|nr:hypothetical protein [Anaerolineae bacterium]